MVLCRYCNNVAENNCKNCDMPICKLHTKIVEKKISSEEIPQVPLCPNCAKELSK